METLKEGRKEDRIEGRIQKVYPPMKRLPSIKYIRYGKKTI